MRNIKYQTVRRMRRTLFMYKQQTDIDNKHKFGYHTFTHAHGLLQLFSDLSWVVGGKNDVEIRMDKINLRAKLAMLSNWNFVPQFPNSQYDLCLYYMEMDKSTSLKENWQGLVCQFKTLRSNVSILLL